MNTVPLNKPHNERVKASELSPWLLSHGVSTITTSEIAALLAIPVNQVPQRLSALKKKGEMVLLANKLWAPVPPEYLTWGAPSAIDFIDSLMGFFKVDYYVGWLSAAALLGASHHASQVFQTATSKPVRNRTIGRSNLQFFHRVHTRQITTVSLETRNGNVKISSKETTMLDIASDIGIVGGVDNAANLIIELCDAGMPNLKQLAELTKHYPSSSVRRLGYILEHFTDIAPLDQLKQISDNRKASVSVLDPQSANVGTIDKYWLLKINKVLACEAFSLYRPTGHTSQKGIENLESKIQNKGFLSDMNNLISPKISDYDPKEAASIIINEYLKNL